MPEFTYNASALGAGGVIQRGSVTTTIPSLASVALAPTGGEGRSVVSNYYSEELAFSHAETRVFGAETSKDSFTTSTYVLIRDLRVFDRLAIDSMRAVVTSTHTVDDPTPEDHPFELKVTYRSVRVDGVEVAPVIDLDVKNSRRYADVQRLLGGATRNRKELEERFGAHDKAAKTLLDEQIRNGRAVQGSLVKSLDHGKKLGQITGHKLRIPKLGTVRFGELMLKPGRRRLNLLRFQFNDDLTFSAFQIEDNEESVQPQRQGVRALARSTRGGFEEGPDLRDGGSMTIASVEGNGSLLVP